MGHPQGRDNLLHSAVPFVIRWLRHRFPGSAARVRGRCHGAPRPHSRKDPKNPGRQTTQRSSTWSWDASPGGLVDWKSWPTFGRFGLEFPKKGPWIATGSYLRYKRWPDRRFIRSILGPLHASSVSDSDMMIPFLLKFLFRCLGFHWWFSSILGMGPALKSNFEQHFGQHGQIKTTNRNRSLETCQKV